MTAHSFLIRSPEEAQRVLRGRKAYVIASGTDGIFVETTHDGILYVVGQGISAEANVVSSRCVCFRFLGGMP